MEFIELIKNIAPNILTGFTLFIAGLLIAFFNLIAIFRGKSYLNWIKTKGIILSSKLIKQRGLGDASVSFKPRVEYQYSIGNQTFKSKRVYFGSNIMSSFKKKKSLRTVDRYKVNNEVDVLYNKMNEKISVLEPGVKSEIVTGFIIGLVFIVIGYIMIKHPEILNIKI